MRIWKLAIFIQAFMIVALLSGEFARAQSDDTATRCRKLAQAKEAIRAKKNPTADEIALTLTPSRECSASTVTNQDITTYKSQMTAWSTCLKTGGSCGAPPEIPGN
jgi:hypothetical protein